MIATRRLLQQVHITLFTRPNCSLCTSAKAVLSDVWDTRPFAYTETDVMSPGQEKWRNHYEFDTPVIHVERNTTPFATTAAARKLMHRFTEKQVKRLMNEVEKDTTQR
ncbi:hypothetical protein M501DRAFT_1013677 [Patellaria atrata CBS 101060]|uniref:Glutaredoxin-like protein n=1 Tax=Patellaria atrata CBS 101060 TaxID=1346257 RepID=A0A9P4SIR2_9PEZI|nr:hypothetical protein M501DRAFT_1013677 [Patellaria atrata CBS 101060]